MSLEFIQSVATQKQFVHARKAKQMFMISEEFWVWAVREKNLIHAHDSRKNFRHPHSVSCQKRRKKPEIFPS